MLSDPAEKLIDIFMGMTRWQVRNKNLGYHAKVHKQEQESEQRPPFVCLVGVVKLQIQDRGNIAFLLKHIHQNPPQHLA